MQQALLDTLRERGRLTEPQVAQALEQVRRGASLVDVLVRERWVGESELLGPCRAGREGWP